MSPDGIKDYRLRGFKMEVTYACDLNCIHCSSDANPANPLEMAREDCLRILNEAAEMDVAKVEFSGGEPLRWQPICEAVEVADSHGFSVAVYTSGNVDGFDKKAERLSELGAATFIFSMYGSTAEVHERVTRVRSSFKRTKRSMRVARDCGLATELHFVPMSNNYQELRRVAEMSRTLGSSLVSVLRLVPQGRAFLLQGRKLTQAQNLELRRIITDLRDDGFQIRTGSPYNFLMLEGRPKCGAGLDRLSIGPDLSFYPCDAFKRIGAHEIVGRSDYCSLREASLQECWEKSPYLQAIRDCLAQPPGEPCNNCRLLSGCMSGCLAQKVLAYGGLGSSADPDCFGPEFTRTPNEL